MATAAEKPAEDVEEVKLNITLNNLDQFEEYTTKIFHVRGNPWSITFTRKKKQF